MRKETFVALGMSEEMAEKAAQASKQEAIENIHADKSLQVEKNLKTEATSETDLIAENLPNTEIVALKRETEMLRRQLIDERTTYESMLAKEKFENAIMLALATAKAKNLKAARALIDIEFSTTEFDGIHVKGLDEKIKSLKSASNTAFLFEQENDGMAMFRGFIPGERRDNGVLSSDMGDGTLTGAVLSAMRKRK